VILALLLACASRVPYGDALVEDVPAPDAYADAVADATRELRLYDRLTTTLLLRAVRLDADFRRTLEAMRAHLMLLEAPARAANLAASLAEAADQHVFVLSADAQDRKALRFGVGTDAPWRLRLFSSGKACTAVAVERRDPTPLDLRLYPFHTSWATLWIARFSTDCGADSPLVLQVTGPGGAGEMGWR